MKSPFNYPIIRYYSEADNCYLAFSPELPGCFADGKTPSEALENIQIIQNEWITTASEMGIEIPKPSFDDEFSSSNPSILDVANYILKKCGNISAMALQKLTYYCLAWSLAWYETALFPEHFCAWRKGPVCPELWEQHRGRYIISEEMLPSNHIFTNTEKHIIDNVLAVYGDEDAQWLSSLTHSERPWKETRDYLPDDAVSKKEIPNELIQEYYQTLQ